MPIARLLEYQSDFNRLTLGMAFAVLLFRVVLSSMGFSELLDSKYVSQNGFFF